MPKLGRRGFRDWSQLVADLAAIQDAPGPLNRARVWMYDPTIGGVAPTGRFAVAGADDSLLITIDGAEVISLDQATVRGGWLGLRDGHYYLDVDIGNRDHIQVSGPGNLPTAGG